MNLGAILTEVRQELQDSPVDAGSRIWSDTELTAYANDGVLLCQQLTEWLETLSNIVPVIGQQDYTLPTNILHLRRVTFDQEYLPQTRVYELDRDRSNWRAAGNGSPIRFFLDRWDTLSVYPKPLAAGTTYTFSSELGVIAEITDGGVPDPGWTFLSELGIIISIQDSADGYVVFLTDMTGGPPGASVDLGIVIAFSTDELNLGMMYVALPETLVNTTDSPQLPSFVHPALVPYICYRAYLREGKENNPKLAGLYFQDFGDWMSSVLILHGRQWPEHILSLDAVTPGNPFDKRLSELPFPSSRGELKAHYG